MKITILTAGTVGDLLPYLWLGRELVSRGHVVRITAGQAVQQLLPETPVEAFTITDPFTLGDDDASQKLIESGSGRAFIKHMREQSASRMQAFLDDCTRACSGTDLILYANLGFAGPHIGEFLGVPYFALPLSPTLSTTEYPAMNLREAPSFMRRSYNRLTHVYAEHLFWRQIGSGINQWRRGALRLKPIPWCGPFGRIRRKGYPFIYLISHAVFPKPHDWPPFAHLVGFQSETVVGSHISHQNQLAAFLEEGSPPIVIALGPTWNNNREAKLQSCLEALKSTGLRAVICDPGSKIPFEELELGIVRVKFAHFPSVLPKVMGVVHHGGAGSTYMCLLNQVPNVAYPLFGDQIMWAKCLHRLKSGPQPAISRELSAGTLTEDLIALRDYNSIYRENLQAVSDLLKAETPVATAANIIEQYYAKVTEGASSNRGAGLDK